MSKRRTSEQWQALVDQQRDSGQSAIRLCKHQRIQQAGVTVSRSTLIDWS